MKKIISFLILCIVSVGLIGCSEDNQTVNDSLQNKEVTNNEIIEIVYNKLPKELKETINFDLKEIKINKLILNEGIGNITDTSYIGKEVYDIEFTIKNTSTLPNNRIVFATLEDYKLIGYGYIE